jgi:hypothetical protein
MIIQYHCHKPSAAWSKSNRCSAGLSEKLACLSPPELSLRSDRSETVGPEVLSLRKFVSSFYLREDMLNGKAHLLRSPEFHPKSTRGQKFVLFEDPQISRVWLRYTFEKVWARSIAILGNTYVY